MFMARYEHATGTISGLWEGTDPALLALQVVPDDPTYGYLLVDDPALSATEIQEHWQVVDGVLVPKPA